MRSAPSSDRGREGSTDSGDDVLHLGRKRGGFRFAEGFRERLSNNKKNSEVSADQRSAFFPPFFSFNLRRRRRRISSSAASLSPSLPELAQLSSDVLPPAASHQRLRRGPGDHDCASSFEGEKGRRSGDGIRRIVFFLSRPPLFPLFLSFSLTPPLPPPTNQPPLTRKRTASSPSASAPTPTRPAWSWTRPSPRSPTPSRPLP